MRYLAIPAKVCSFWDIWIHPGVCYFDGSSRIRLISWTMSQVHPTRSGKQEEFWDIWLRRKYSLLGPISYLFVIASYSVGPRMILRIYLIIYLTWSSQVEYFWNIGLCRKYILLIMIGRIILRCLAMPRRYTTWTDQVKYFTYDVFDQS